MKCPEQSNCCGLSYKSITSLESSSPAKVNRMDYSDLRIGLHGFFKHLEQVTLNLFFHPFAFNCCDSPMQQLITANPVDQTTDRSVTYLLSLCVVSEQVTFYCLRSLLSFKIVFPCPWCICKPIMCGKVMDFLRHLLFWWENKFWNLISLIIWSGESGESNQRFFFIDILDITWQWVKFYLQWHQLTEYSFRIPNSSRLMSLDLQK